MNTISEKGNIIINKFFNDKEIFLKKEYLDHDGFDEYGPKSNLWSLFIIVKEDDKFILYEYYYEDWFSKYYIDDYELLNKKNLNKNILDFISNIENCNNKEFKKRLKLLI